MKYCYVMICYVVLSFVVQLVENLAPIADGAFSFFVCILCVCIIAFDMVFLCEAVLICIFFFFFF